MKKNQINLLILGLFFTALTLACNWNRSGAGGGQSANVNEPANVGGLSTTSKTPIAECPKTTLNVSATKDSMGLYEGCLLTVEGKIMEITGSSINLGETWQDQYYYQPLTIYGNFSSSTYSEVGRKIQAFKDANQYNRLPIAIFTCIVESGTTGEKQMRSCVLTEIKK